MHGKTAADRDGKNNGKKNRRRDKDIEHDQFFSVRHGFCAFLHVNDVDRLPVSKNLYRYYSTLSAAPQLSKRKTTGKAFRSRRFITADMSKNKTQEKSPLRLISV
jgi:hypothetical protein